MRAIAAAAAFWGFLALSGALITDVHMFYGAAALALLLVVLYLLVEIRKELHRDGRDL